MAAERALQVDPAYQLAGLLLQALQAGLPPSVFEQASADERTRRGQPPTSDVDQPWTAWIDAASPDNAGPGSP